MAHLRKQIRDRITTTLTGLTTTGNNVFQTRKYPLSESKLPGIAIYTNSHEFEPLSINPPRTLNNTLDIVIELYVKNTNSEDVLDTVSEEVEAALYADLELNGLVDNAYQVSMDIDHSADGDQPVTLGKMVYRVNYTSVEGSQTQ